MLRRAKIMTMLGLLVLCGSAWAVEPNLVSHWKFDEGGGTTAYDSAGSNDGTIYGAVWTTGQIDGALDFDGNEDYVEVPSSVSLDSTTATWSLWVKPTGDPGGSGSSPWGTGCIMTRGDSWGTWNGVHISLIPHATYGTIAIQVKANANPSVLVEDTVFSSPDITYNEWSHIAFVFDSGNYAELYVNGALTVNYTLGNFAFNNQVLRIATSTDPYLYDFNGEVDEVVIHDRALSAEEIEELYHGQLLSLEIVGPAEVAENSQVSYKAIAHYDIGSPKDVTNSADWSVEPNAIASINGNGLLTTEEIYILEEDITIYAQYTEDTNTFEAEKEVSVFAVCPTGTALSFDGVNDYVAINGVEVHKEAAYSIIMWVKGVAQADNRVYSEGCSSNNDPLLNIGSHHISTSKARFQVRDDNGIIRLDAESIATAFDSTWHQIAWVDNNGNYATYIDGVADVSGSYTKNAKTLDRTTIGAFGRIGYSCSFDGLIDDVCIYDRALSPEEIQANMHILLSGDEPNLVGYWDFDEGEGQIAYDLSSSGNNGYLGSDPCDVDSADPAWVESDAPIGICTTGGLIERNITRALESKQRALEEIEAALANENATIGVLEALFRSRDYGNLDKNDIVKAKQEIHSAVQNEQRSTDTLEKSIEKLEDSLSVLGYEVEPNGSSN